jgi:hypothetical protein
VGRTHQGAEFIIPKLERMPMGGKIGRLPWKCNKKNIDGENGLEMGPKKSV